MLILSPTTHMVCTDGQLCKVPLRFGPLREVLLNYWFRSLNYDLKILWGLYNKPLREGIVQQEQTNTNR